MNYKPDEGTLMAYLYGELESAEKEKVSQYLTAHPEEFKKLQEMADVLKIMGAVQEKEVIAPPVLEEHSTHTISFWRTTAFKIVASIAASLLLLIVAGKVIGPDVRYNKGELTITYRAPEPEVQKTEKAALSAEAVQQMIDQSMKVRDAAVDSRLAENQKRLNNSIHESLAVNSKKVDDLVKNTSQASNEQLRSYVAGLQTENLKLIKDYFQLTSKEQNDYVENLLIGFSKYMQEQRKQDLVLVQNKVNDLEKNSDQFQHETEQLLASIISNTKTVKSY